MAGKGMLGDLFSPTARSLRDEELDEERVHQYQAQDPFRAMAHTAYTGGTLAGKGLGRVAVAATGGDPRTSTERNVDAVRAAKEQVAQLGFDPNDPESLDQFYKQVISILQKQGLAAEALAVAKEWNAEKHKTKQEALKTRDLELRAERDKRAHELGILRVATQQEIAMARNINARELAEMRLTAEQMRDGPFKAIDYNDRVEIINRHGEVVSVKPKAMNPKDTAKDDDAKQKMATGYQSAYLKAQADYDAAVELHNHPRLEGAVGPIDSIVADTNPSERGIGTRLFAATKSAGERRAAALIQTVKAGAFLTGFQEIKTAAQAAGAQGAGFGALSDAEGARIQAAKASLDAVQDAREFRVALANYIRQMVESWKAVSTGAAQAGIQPKMIVEKPLTAGRRTPKAKPGATPVPMPVVPAPATPGAPEKVEKWERVNGKLQRVN